MPQSPLRHVLAGLVPAALLLAGLGLAGCDQQKNAYAPPPPPKVGVAKPVTRSVVDYLEFSGNTRSAETVELRARVPGFLRSVEFKDGAMVKKGATLFTIEPENYEATLKEAQAGLAALQATLKRAEVELARARKLKEAKAGPETDVIQWTQELETAKANIALQQAKIDQAKLDLGYTRVTAPFDGRIGRSLADPGNLVGASDKTLLATIIRLDPIYAYFTLNERDYLRLMHASGASLGRQPGKQGKAPVLEMGLGDKSGYPFQGKLDFVDLGVDPSTGTIMLRGVFPNAEHDLVPGLFVRIRAPLEVKDALLVPETALGVSQLGRYALVVNFESQVESRQVQVGPTVDGMVVVTKGLGPEDRVIVRGGQLARPGAPVVAEEIPAQPAGAKQ